HFSSGDYQDLAVYLSGSDYHTGWANRALLRRSGITKDFIQHLPSTDRQYYGVDSSFEPNGFLVDAGLRKVQEHLPQPTVEELLEEGRAASRWTPSPGLPSWRPPPSDESMREPY